MPKVSVIIPAYNRADMIGEAVNSALSQTWRDFELLVIDDGSTDNTAEVIHGFGDPRLRYVYQPNRGLPGTRNEGIRLSQGEYIAFLDSDDVWLPAKLGEQVPIMDRSPAVGLVYCGAYIFEGQQTFTEQRPRARGDVLKTLLLEDNIVCGSGSTPLIRRACFERAGLFDESLKACEDWDMWLRIACSGYEFDFVPRALVRCRVHGSNLQKNAARMGPGTRAFFEKILAEPAYYARGDIARRRVESLAEFMVGRQYYTARLMGAARPYFVRSLALYPGQSRALRHLLRSLLGAQLTERMRGWRNRLLHLVRYRRTG